MIDVFDAMSASTSGDVRLLAAGVSKATLPTVAGMVAAVSGLLALTVVKNSIGRLNRNFSNKLPVTQVSKSV
jgi:biopolymer transport protein ExbB